jgi:hypothetical protein
MKRSLCIIVAAAALQSCIHSVKPAASLPEHHETFVFRAEPAVIKPGDESTLLWNVPGVSSVIIEGAVGFGRLRQLGVFSNPGSLKVSPLADSIYVISCGESSSTLCESVNVRVRVRQR